MARALTVLLAAASLAAGCGGTGPPASAPERPGQARATVLGVVWVGRSGTLRRLDALTLRPVGPPGAKVPAGVRKLSPDGRTVVLGAGDGALELRFADVRTLRPIGRPIRLAGWGWIGEILWESSDRMLVLSGGNEPRVTLVDPLARRVVDSFPLEGTIGAVDARAARLVVVLSPQAAIGPARLAVFDAVLGHLATVPLPEIHAGTERIDHPDDSHAARQLWPGVAISPDGTRAVVVPPGNRVAEVSLDTAEVVYRELSEPVSLLGKLRNWLEPVAHAKVVVGSSRQAAWLGERYVAVTGTDIRGVSAGKWDASAAGLRLIDTRDWSVRTVADAVSGLRLSRDLLLSFGGVWPEGSPGTGLLAFGPDGERRLHALGEQRVGWVETSWPYAYVPEAGGRRFSVVDLRTSRLLSRAAAENVSILGD